MDTNKAARRFQFTWNNYTQDDVDRLQDTDKLDPSIDYLIFAFEIGEKGTPHLQGYVEYSKATRIAASCKKLDPTRGGRAKDATPHQVRCEIANKNRQANINYVRKRDTKDPDMMLGDEPIIFTWQREGRKRTRGEGCAEADESAEERKAEWAAKLEYLREHPQLDTFAKENPEEGFRHAHAIKALALSMQETAQRETVASKYPANMRMRLWQRSIVTMLQKPADDRTIIWIYDEEGSAGKSILTKWLGIHMDACCLSNGRTMDIAFAYKGQRIVIFDFSRTMEDKINYSAIESLKNGTMFSPKYESTSKMVVPPWVLCLSNSRPQLHTMTMDRWMVIDTSMNLKTLELEANDDGLLTEVRFTSSKGITMNDPVLASMMGL